MITKERTFGRSMLEYSKMVLSKMSFDRKLFRKEYRKAFRYLDRQEQAELKAWLRSEKENFVGENSDCYDTIKQRDTITI